MKKKLLMFIVLIGIVFALASCTTSRDPDVIANEPSIVQIENDITEVYEKVSKGCVGIIAQSSTSGSLGSGVVYKEDNGYYYVITNHHVIDSMTSYKVYLGGTKYYTATLIGSDASNDIAVLRFTLDILGSKNNVYVNDIFNYEEEDLMIPGQTVLAIGCPLSLDYFNTLTTGVVSKLTSLRIQHDAQINPGNSGGGLFNLEGRLIGINVEKIISVDDEDGIVPIEGLAFAIPLDVVKNCVTKIESKNGSITRPTLGVQISVVNRYLHETSIYLNLMPAALDEAIFITQITFNGNAYQSTLKVNDIILRVDGKDIETSDDISYALNSKLVGDTIELYICRVESGSFVYDTITVNLQK